MILRNPVWHALTGPQADFARPGPVGRDGTPRAVQFDPEVSVFAGVADAADPGAWADLAAIVGPGGTAVVMLVDDEDDARPSPPAGWTVLHEIAAVQMVAEAMEPAVDAEAVGLGPDDAPEMLDLVERTRPGPFMARTVELGGYLGIRSAGRLVAMAGQRFRPAGYREISAVCTDPAWRGQGLGRRLVRAVAADITATGDIPILHTQATNTVAIRLYETLGLRVTRPVRFVHIAGPVA